MDTINIISDIVVPYPPNFVFKVNNEYFDSIVMAVEYRRKIVNKCKCTALIIEGLINNSWCNMLGKYVVVGLTPETNKICTNINDALSYKDKLVTSGYINEAYINVGLITDTRIDWQSFVVEIYDGKYCYDEMKFTKCDINRAIIEKVYHPSSQIVYNNY